jgi:regulator of sigma E protease
VTGVLMGLLALLVTLGPLIFVHEMGHFVAAKAVGIQVLRFSLGFGRPLLRWQRGETEYWISWLPLGGYVKMAGLEDEGVTGTLEGGKASVPIDPARAVDRKPVWQRMIVVVAGVTANVVLAFVVYTGIAAVLGTARLAVTQVDAVRTAVLPPGAEELGTLRWGDRITAINGDTVRAWDDVVEHFLAGPTEVRIAVAGRPTLIEVHLPADSGARGRVVQALVPLTPPRIGFVLPGQPAARAGLRPGDLVVRVDRDTIRSWNDMLHAIWYAPGRTLHLSVLRDGRLEELAVKPDSQTETDPTSPRPRTYGIIGANQDPPVTRSHVSFGRAVAMGADQTVTQAAAVVVSVKKLVFRQASIKEVGGPILIAKMSGQAASLGPEVLLGFLAFFSISLAVLNLLPIPVLDGGQVVFLIAEAIRRRPLSLELRMRLTQIGFVVIIALMLLGIANDILRDLPR